MSPEHSNLLRRSFTGLYPLDQSELGKKAFENALKTPEKFVLKPQREGGGNNYYGMDVKTKLLSMDENERLGYILMDLIKPPPLVNTMVRRETQVDADVISEFGVYGVYLSLGGVTLVNKAAGHLLRTKSSDSNEGGVAAGFAVLDSPVLI